MNSKYDFISYLDSRNHSAPIHPGYAWPDKDIEVTYAGEIRIIYKG